MKAKFSDFEAGALWALGLLRKQHDARMNAFRKHEHDLGSDIAGLLSAGRNIEVGMLSRFESAFIRELAAASAAHSNPPPEGTPALAVGTKVQFNAFNGSIGEIIGVRDNNTFTVRWVYGRDVKGEVMGATSDRVSGNNLNIVTEEEFVAMRDRKGWGENQKKKRGRK